MLNLAATMDAYVGSGSITKEFPLETLAGAIQAIRPGMTYEELRQYARANSNDAVPALLANRFLLVEEDGTIRFDLFLSLATSEGVNTPRFRKIMYLVWMLRELRLRRFVCEVVADNQGRWRPGRLTDKSRAVFFEEFFEPSTTPKVRSNFERFCVEAGIYDEDGRAVHLELDDGWLEDGMRVAAQHERNASRRRAMTSAPAEFLIANGWHGLANATVEQLRGLAATTMSEPEPLEDEEIDRSPRSTQSQVWNRPKPTHSGRTTTNALVDLVARERASTAHHLLEKLMAEAATAKGHKPKFNNQIDMHFATPTGVVLAEMKSCHSGNVHSQIRRGISQLFEYRFVYRSVLGEKVVPTLVVETRPGGGQEWMLEYLKSLGIVLAWKEPGQNRLVTTMGIPPALVDVVFPAG